MNTSLKLYSYWRSSAAYRVRIALNLKHIRHEIVPVHLIANGGEQHAAVFHGLNPQDLVPVLTDGQRIIRQSLAIIEYLEESYPEHPIMPATARERARVRGLAHMIACDIHPLNNLRVLQHFERDWNVPQSERNSWVKRWIRLGFEAIEVLLADNPSTGDFCEGEIASMADCCLIPQVYNAQRYDVDLGPYPTIRRINSYCLELPEFDKARPEHQTDAPQKA